MLFRRQILAAWLLTTLVGCQSLTSGSTTVKTMKRPLADAGSQSNPGDESSDPWINEAGNIARGERSPEPDEDPLGLRKYFVSDRARDIERNLGVGK